MKSISKIWLFINVMVFFCCCCGAVVIAILLAVGDVNVGSCDVVHGCKCWLA